MKRRRGLVDLTVILGIIGLLMLIVVVGYVLKRSGGRAVPVVPEVTFAAGVPDRGRELIEAYGCVTCHEVPGTRGVGGQVGPPLSDIGHRALIAGRLPNTPENLVAWIMDPQAIAPGSGMPDMGVTLPDALDMAAFLYGTGGEE